MSTPINSMSQPPRQDGWDKSMNLLSSCGKFAGMSTAIVCIILIVCFCGIGIYFFRKKDKTVYNSVSATITLANCSQVVNRNGNRTTISYNCALQVKYTVDGKEYTASLTSDDTVHNANETITIYYDVSNPNNVVYSYIKNKSMGQIMIGAGACFIVLLIIHLILMKKSEWYNRIHCINTVSSVVGSSFRGNNNYLPF